MGNINLLDPSVASLIAAGEVVERPASVVKELVENSIDAKASVITVEIKNGGISYIRVTDNGCGIEAEDVGLAFVSHATSKITSANDLESIYTLGFRGEALNSIAAVSKVRLITKTAHAPCATQVLIEGGEMEDVKETGAPNGTTIEVRTLFYNTPARMKFLKKDTTEAGHVADVMQRFVLARPDISFRFINNGKQQILSPGDGDLKNAIYTIYGKDYAASVLPVSFGDNTVKVEGFIGKSNISRPNRNYQSFFVNNRYIKSRIVAIALEEAYKGQLMSGKFPFAVLKLTINPAFLDINVHPSKMEVKFSDEKKVFDTVYWGAKNTLYEKPIVPKITLPGKGWEYPKEAPPQKTYKKDLPKIDDIKLEKYFYKNISENKTDANSKDYAFPTKPNSFKESVSDTYQTVLKAPDNTSQDTPKEAHDFKIDAKKPKDNITAQGYPASEAKPKGDIQSLKIIGQAFKTYIVAEYEDQLLLIDQHAAHERLKYEQLKEALSKGDIISQTLLAPVIVNLSPTEFSIAKENIDFFNKIGFEIEEFGDYTIIIRLTPIDLVPEELADLFLELLGQFANSKREIVADKQQRALYTIACKAALKANRSMQPDEMRALVLDVLGLDGINTCPHGRPIMISLTKHELEKQFKRIV